MPIQTRSNGKEFTEKDSAMSLLLASLLLLPNHPSPALEISNFRSGLACTHTRRADDSVGWICQPTQDVLVTDQGSCVFNGVTKHCTWIGFEFDYKSANKHTKLQCVEDDSQPSDLGNPGELLEKHASTQRFALQLDGESGHFFNPQYFVFTTRPKNGALLIVKGSCAVDGIVAFEYQFNLRFPVAGGD